MGATLMFGDTDIRIAGQQPVGTDMVGAKTKRARTLPGCLRICTLGLRHHWNFRRGTDYVMTNTPGMLRAMGGMMDRDGRQA